MTETESFNIYISSLYTFLDKVSDIAEYSTKKMNKVLIVSALSGLWISFFSYKILGLSTIAGGSIAFIMLVPAIITFYMTTHLNAIIGIGEKVKDFEGALKEAVTQKKDMNKIDLEVKPTKNKLKQLLQFKLIAWKLKGTFEEIGHLDVLAGIITVGNPLFISVLAIMTFIAGGAFVLSLITGTIALFAF
jgi:hypothetical protein